MEEKMNEWIQMLLLVNMIRSHPLSTSSDEKPEGADHQEIVNHPNHQFRRGRGNNDFDAIRCKWRKEWHKEKGLYFMKFKWEAPVKKINQSPSFRMSDVLQNQVNILF